MQVGWVDHDKGTLVGVTTSSEWIGWTLYVIGLPGLINTLTGKGEGLSGSGESVWCEDIAWKLNHYISGELWADLILRQNSVENCLQTGVLSQTQRVAMWHHCEDVTSSWHHYIVFGMGLWMGFPHQLPGQWQRNVKKIYRGITHPN